MINRHPLVIPCIVCICDSDGHSTEIYTCMMNGRLHAYAYFNQLLDFLEYYMHVSIASLNIAHCTRCTEHMYT